MALTERKNCCLFPRWWAMLGQEFLRKNPQGNFTTATQGFSFSTHFSPWSVEAKLYIDSNFCRPQAISMTEVPEHWSTALRVGAPLWATSWCPVDSSSAISTVRVPFWFHRVWLNELPGFHYGLETVYFHWGLWLWQFAFPSSTCEITHNFTPAYSEYKLQ